MLFFSEIYHVKKAHQSCILSPGPFRKDIMFKLAAAREMCLLVVELRNRVSNKIRVQHKLLPPTQMGAAANVVICLYCNTAPLIKAFRRFLTTKP